MNDEFLYRLRADPPSGFALRLKNRLDRQAASAEGRRVSILRLFVVASLVGASAFAVMSPTVRDKASAWMASLRSADEAPAPAALPKEASSSSASPAADSIASAADESPFGDMGKTGASPMGGAAKGDGADTGTRNARGLGRGAASSASANAAAGKLRNEVMIVGSPVVFPFTKAVADEWSERFRRPRFDITNTDTGFAEFCNGRGAWNPDIAQATRAMAAQEIEECAQNGVSAVYEIKVGYTAMALVMSLAAVPMQMTRRDLHRALARHAPEPSGSVPNLTRTWQDVEPSLPNLRIEILGPRLALEGRDAFAEMLLQPGCSTYPWHDSIRARDPKGYERVCGLVRDDGVYIGTTDDGAAVLRRLDAAPNAVGIVDYRFFDANRDRLQEVPVEGVRAVRETIANGAYPVARPLYLYVKGSQLTSVRDLLTFVYTYVHEDSIGRRGSLIQVGLIPLADDERNTLRSNPFAVNVIR